MPRILPRLLKRLANSGYERQNYTIPYELAARKSRKSLHKRVPSYTLVNPTRRSRSILLDPINPIINAQDFVHHKSLPPKPVLPNAKVADGEVYDVQRVMSEQELNWWSNPYLRMLSSRLRQCIITHRYLPTDFLIRVAAMSLPTPRMSRPAQSLLPDGLQHHKFKQRKSGFGHYFTCWKDALQELTDKKLPRRSATNISTHPLLAHQIGHLLRVRVLQELELLARSGKKRLKIPHSSSLRRLTRGEWKSFKLTGVIPYPNAVALLVVPPLNKNPITKARPVADASASPEAADDVGSHPNPIRPLPPSSELHPITGTSADDDMSLPDVTSEPSVPLYNGLTLFPSRPQRAALHERLCAVLRTESHSRHLHTNLPHFGNKPGEIKTDDKSSHAFLLCSDASTAKRADTVPLAIALWRVRMWEGYGWGETGRWEVRSS